MACGHDVKPKHKLRPEPYLQPQLAAVVLKENGKGKNAVSTHVLKAIFVLEGAETGGLRMARMGK